MPIGDTPHGHSPSTLRLAWDASTPVRLSGGPGSGRTTAVRRDASDQGVDPCWLDLHGVFDADGVLAAVAERAARLGREQPLVLDGLDAALLDEPAVLWQVAERISGRPLVGIADAMASGPVQHVHLGAAVDDSGVPSDWIRELIAAQAMPVRVPSATLARWAAATEGWPLAAVAAGSVLRALGASAPLDPAVWLAMSLEGAPTRWASVADALHHASEWLAPNERAQLAVLVDASPLLSSPHLAPLIRSGQAPRGVPPCLLDAGWIVDASGSAGRHWFVPWLRTWHLWGSETCATGAREAARPTAETLRALGTEALDDLRAGTPSRSMHVRMLRAAQRWFAPDATWSCLGDAFGLLDGVLRLDHHDLVGGTAALEKVWASATDAGDQELVRTSAELLAEGFARRGERKRSQAYLAAARAAMAGAPTPRATVLDTALAGGPEAVVAARRLERFVEERDDDGWLRAARVALEVLFDGGVREGHAEFARRLATLHHAEAQPTPTWLRLHLAHADIFAGETCDASRAISRRGLALPIGSLAASDIATLCGERTAALRWARRASTMARARGHLGTALSADLRVMFLQLAACESVPSGAILRMNRRAARIGRADVRQLLTAVSLSSGHTPPCQVTSDDPIVHAAWQALAIQSGTRAPSAQATATTAFSARLVRGACEDVKPIESSALCHGVTLQQSPPALRVDAAPWFDLGRYGLYHRLVMALVEARGEAPGVPVALDPLVAAMWPDERILPESASNRFHKTLSTFRKRVSATLIERTDDGYRIPPEVGVRVEHGARLCAACAPHKPWSHHPTAVARLIELEQPT